MRKAVIYARHSKIYGADKLLEQQIDLCKHYAERNGYEVMKIYSDIGLATDSRPGYDELLSDASTAEWEYVIVGSCDRLTVTFDQMVNGIAPLREADVRIVDVKRRCIYDLTEMKDYIDSNPIFRLGGTK